jgi:hypothetical protein
VQTPTCSVGPHEFQVLVLIERALRYHPHGAARGVGGLRHRVEGAVAANGDHRRPGGDSLGRSHLRHADLTPAELAAFVA